MNPNSTVFPTTYGKGLFAAKNLKAGSIVERYHGEIKVYHEVPDELKRYVYDVGYLYGDDMWLIPEANALFINHSCDPNCIVSKDLYVILQKDINAGEELTISYNKVDKDLEKYHWKPEWTFECQCGADNCQRLINNYTL